MERAIWGAMPSLSRASPLALKIVWAATQRPFLKERFLSGPTWAQYKLGGGGTLRAPRPTKVDRRVPFFFLVRNAGGVAPFHLSPKLPYVTASVSHS